MNNKYQTLSLLNTAKLVMIFVLSVFTLSYSFTVTAQPETNTGLASRAGGTMVYDAGQDITWLLIRAPKSSEGGISWAEANLWAENLTAGGATEWRLPSGGNPLRFLEGPNNHTLSVGQSMSEYQLLWAILGNHSGELSQTTFVDTSSSETVNMGFASTARYWESEDGVANGNADNAWYAFAGNLGHSWANKASNTAAWSAYAVLDGDIGNVTMVNNDKPVIAAGVNENGSIQEVVVFGIRKSLDTALDIKKNAATVVDVITAEDIGQFSDDSIAGAIQRIPGVQIEKDPAGTDGDRVSIRGLGPEFVNSTINGRTLLSSGNEGRGLRKMNFNVFPSSILSGVRVAKGQMATLPESGLAGQVNLQTIRPLDMVQLKRKNTFGRLSYRLENRDLYHEDGALLEGSYAWRNEDNTLGLFVGGVTGESDISNEQFSQTREVVDIGFDDDGDGITDRTVNDVSVPGSNTNSPIRNTTEREAVTVGLQWRPSDAIEVSWDLTTAEFNDYSVRNVGQILFPKTLVWRNIEGNPAGFNAVFDPADVEIDENNILRYADFSNVDGGNSPVCCGGKSIRRSLGRINTQIFNSETSNLISGLNFKWYGDRSTADFDIYYSSVDYKQELRFPIFNNDLDTSALIYDGRGDIPTITSTDDDDRLNPEGYDYLFTVAREVELEAENFGATFKWNYATDDSDLFGDWLSSVDLGVHYERTDIISDRSLAQRFIDPADPGATICCSSDPTAASTVGAAALSEQVNGFFDGENFSPGTWPAGDFDVIGEFDPRIYTTGINNLGIDPAASYSSIEEISALFGQLNVNTDVAGYPVTGNAGLRAVYTQNRAQAFTVTTLDSGDSLAPALTQTGGDYWEYLPSLNLNVGLKNNLALRFGFSKTLSRPEFNQMAPIVSVNVPLCAGAAESEVECRSVITKGNPDLKPMTAYNYDMTLEWYNDYEGSLIGSVFYKDVSDFILQDLLIDQTIAGQPSDVLFNSSTPVNFSDGEAKGYEIAFYQPLGSLHESLKGFGVQLNYTRVETKFDEDVGDSGYGFPGSSKNNYNAVMFYETRSFGARMAYTYRDDFFRTLADQGSQTSDARFTEDSKNLNFNIRFNPYPKDKNLLVVLNANNLLDDDRRDFIGDKANFLSYFRVGRTYSLTTTYTF
jgi:TonB-dependent receptor